MKQQLLILPTSDIVADFFKDVKNMTNHDYDIGEIIKDVFACLSILPDVDDNIIAACDKIINSYVRAQSEDDGVVLANAFGNFARNIKAVFHTAEAWDSNGILRISYFEAIRDDWVVKVDSCTQVNKIGRGLTTPIVEWASDADYDIFLAGFINGPSAINITPYTEERIKEITSSTKPKYYAMSKGNNENNPKQ